MMVRCNYHCIDSNVCLLSDKPKSVARGGGGCGGYGGRRVVTAVVAVAVAVSPEVSPVSAPLVLSHVPHYLS